MERVGNVLRPLNIASSSCFCFPRAGITDLCHCGWLVKTGFIGILKYKEGSTRLCVCLLCWIALLRDSQKAVVRVSYTHRIQFCLILAGVTYRLVCEVCCCSPFFHPPSLPPSSPSSLPSPSSPPFSLSLKHSCCLALAGLELLSKPDWLWTHGNLSLCFLST